MRALGRLLLLLGAALLRVRRAHPQDSRSDIGEAPSNNCRRYISHENWSTVFAERRSMPIALYGVRASAGVRLARERLDAAGLCYTERYDVTHTGPLVAYMRCLVWATGSAAPWQSLDSFVWIGGEFRGDGYALAEDGMSETVLAALAAEAGAEQSCADTKQPCSGEALAAGAAEVTRICCEDPSAGCDPWPRSCSATCLEVWLPFWQSCYAELSAGMVSDDQQLQDLTSFAMLCGGGKSSGGARGPGAAAAPGVAVVTASELTAVESALVQAYRPICTAEHTPCRHVSATASQAGRC